MNWPWSDLLTDVVLTDAVVSFQDELITEEAQLDAILDLPLRPFDANMPHSIVWTDGACSNNQDARFRRGGCGVFHAADHPSNISCALPGVSQSNNRAELLAVILALQQHSGPLEVRTDSSYVVQGAQCLKTNGCYTGRDNVTLWNKLQHLVLERPADSLLVCWVKGHATEHHILRGLSTREDKEGNDGADSLATRGAALHAAPEHLPRDAAWTLAAAKTVQRMMIAILVARWQAEVDVDSVLSEPALADPG